MQKRSIQSVNLERARFNPVTEKTVINPLPSVER